MVQSNVERGLAASIRVVMSALVNDQMGCAPLGLTRPRVFSLELPFSVAHFVGKTAYKHFALKHSQPQRKRADPERPALRRTACDNSNPPRLAKLENWKLGSEAPAFSGKTPGAAGPETC
jgi:hypothetical protein